MYREDGWVKGYYIDNHKKYTCNYCEKDFIVGEKLLEDCASGFPVCPYCGNTSVECIVSTEDDQLEELNSNMGCLAIYVDSDIDYNEVAQMQKEIHKRRNQLGDEYLKVLEYKDYGIYARKIAIPSKGDELGYIIDNKRFSDNVFNSLGDAVTAIDIMLED